MSSLRPLTGKMLTRRGASAAQEFLVARQCTLRLHLPGKKQFAPLARRKLPIGKISPGVEQYRQNVLAVA